MTGSFSRLALLVALALPAGAAAAEGPPGAEPLAEPLDATEMAETRGGYAPTDGFLVRFGIDVATYANGKLLASARLGQGEIGTGGVHIEASTLTHPKLPPGLDLDMRLGDGRFLNVIRNDLDNQVLRTVAAVNIDVFNPHAAPIGGLMDTLTGTQVLLGLR